MGLSPLPHTPVWLHNFSVGDPRLLSNFVLLLPSWAIKLRHIPSRRFNLNVIYFLIKIDRYHYNQLRIIFACFTGPEDWTRVKVCQMISASYVLWVDVSTLWYKGRKPKFCYFVKLVSEAKQSKAKCYCFRIYSHVIWLGNLFS